MNIVRRLLPFTHQSLRPSIITPLQPSLTHSRNMSSFMTPVFTENAAPPAGPYSQAIKTPTAIYCSGQIPCDASGTLIEGTTQELTRACIQNLKAVLEEAGSGIEKVVKVNVFLIDMSDFPKMNDEYSKWFTHKPARSCVAVKQLPKGVDVEIECIALP